jgi:hypothetical protein
MDLMRVADVASISQPGVGIVATRSSPGKRRENRGSRPCLLDLSEVDDIKVEKKSLLDRCFQASVYYSVSMLAGCG